MAKGIMLVAGSAVLLVALAMTVPVSALTCGGLLVLLGVVDYAVTALMIARYIERAMPGLLDLDAALPPPPAGRKYLWEYAAGKGGPVPTWVSTVGLVGVGSFLGGVLMLAIAAVRWAVR
jgi:hypothetical protein